MFTKHRVYTVKTYGAEVLDRIARPVEKIDDQIRQLSDLMTQSVNVFDGIGLAAPQIGVDLRVVVLNLSMESLSSPPSPGELELLPHMPVTLINPEIVSYGSALGWYDEGCLSVPDIFAPVERPLFCRLRTTLLDGKELELECGGLLARCIQHELDHLDGRTFISRLTPEHREKVERQLQKLYKFGAKHDFSRQIRVR